jgi:methyl-accepting chemotaxis protein
MAADIVLEIEINGEQAQKTLKEISDKTKKVGVEIEQNIESPIEKTLQAINALNNGIDTVVKSFENMARILNVVARAASLDVFGRFISKENQKRIQIFASEFQEISDIVSNIRTDPIKSIEDSVTKAESILAKYKKTATIAGVSTVGLGAAILTTSKNYLQFRQGFFEGQQLFQRLNADITKTGTTLKQVFGFVPQKFGGNIFGLVDLLGGVAIALGALGTALNESENGFVRVAGKAALLAAAISGGLSLGIIKLVSVLGDLTFNIGTKLVSTFTNAAKSFAKFEKQTVIFTRTIEGFTKVFGASLGTVDEFSRKIDDISRRTGISAGELRKSAAELFAAGSQLGLTAAQTDKLLDIIVDYSVITGDAFQTTIDFVGALQGNTQSLIKYGIKLNDSSIQTALYSKGVNVAVESLNDFEKEQARLLKILSIYPTIAGKAEAVSNTLAGSQERLNTNIERLNIALGKGASVIENYNLVAFALSNVLDNISGTVFEIAGFFGALTGRVLQATGVALKFSFALVGVVKGVTLLDTLLSTNTWDNFASKRLPKLNQSLRETLLLLGATNVRLKSTKDVLITFGQLTSRLFLDATNIVLGTKLQFLSFSGVLGGVYSRSVQIATKATNGLAKALKFLFATKIGLAITAAVSGFVLLKNALQLVEERTKVFSKFYQFLLDTFVKTPSIFQPIFDLFSAFADFLATKFFQAIGLTTVAISKLLSGLLALAKLNPFSIFANETIDNIEEVQKALDGLSKSVIDVGFDIRKLATETLPESNDPFNETRDNIRGIATEFVNLDNELGRFVGDSQYSAAISRIRDGSLTVQQAAKEGLGPAIELIKVQARAVSAVVNNLVVEGFATIGRSLVQGKSAFADFARTVAGILGDFFIQLGTTIIAADQAIIALKTSLLNFFGGAGLVAGAALIVAGGALKALSGGPSSTATPTALGGAGGGEDFASIGAPTVDTDVSQQIQQAQPSIFLTVEGNILDRRETGLELAEAINEAFQGNGVVFNT